MMRKFAVFRMVESHPIILSAADARFTNNNVTREASHGISNDEFARIAASARDGNHRRDQTRL
jgi:hypothetical protein